MSISKRLHAISYLGAEYAPRRARPAPRRLQLKEVLYCYEFVNSGWDFENRFPKPLDVDSSQFSDWPPELIARWLRHALTDLRRRFAVAESFARQARLLTEFTTPPASSLLSAAEAAREFAWAILSDFRATFGPEAADALLRLARPSDSVSENCEKATVKTQERPPMADASPPTSPPENWGPLPNVSDDLSSGKIHNSCGGAGCPECQMTGYETMGRAAIENLRARLGRPGEAESSKPCKKSSNVQLTLF